MEREGPALQTLTHRVSETPEDFLGEPRQGKKGTIAVSAVAMDLCRRMGSPAPVSALIAIEGKGGTRNALGVTLILCWLLADEWFAEHVPDAPSVVALLGAGARELAEHTASHKFVNDVERREELARFALARLGLRPAGETRAQAEDRLTSLSAAERARVVRAARDAEARARAVREALAKKAAEESADKWTRE
jgi:hypothetical protein